MLELLLSKRIVTDRGCWEYKGSRHERGYGIIWMDGQKWRAHRLAFKLWKGEIPEGLEVLHSCDNPPCFNPAHLSAGTHLQNMREMVERGRVRVMGRKLTPDQVKAIRAMDGTMSRRKIARLFNMEHSSINSICNGKSYLHV